MIGHISLDMKILGKRSAGNLHAAFDEAGIGNVITGVRTEAHMRKQWKKPPIPKVRAPILDPTLERRIKLLEKNKNLKE